MSEFVCRVCGKHAAVDVTNLIDGHESGSYCIAHAPKIDAPVNENGILGFLRDLPSDASLADVIRAINEDRARSRATYFAPRIRWADRAHPSHPFTDAVATTGCKATVETLRK